jgi:hypothetical protein
MSGSDRYVSDVRSCVKGILNSSVSVQESWSWCSHSFLHFVDCCQDNRIRFHAIEPEAVGHTGLTNCLHACSKVHMDRIGIPELLQPYHPKRWGWLGHSEIS